MTLAAAFSGSFLSACIVFLFRNSIGLMFVKDADVVKVSFTCTTSNNAHRNTVYVSDSILVDR